MRDQLSGKNQNLEALRTSFSLKADEVDELKKKYDNKVQEAERISAFAEVELEQNNAENRANMDRVQGELAEMKDLYDKKVQEFGEYEKMMRDGVNKKNTRIDSLFAEARELKERVKDCDTKEATIDNLQEVLRRLQDEFEKVQAENKLHMEFGEAHQRDLILSETKNEDLSKRIQELTDINSQLQETIKRQDTSINRLTQEMGESRLSPRPRPTRPPPAIPSAQPSNPLVVAPPMSPIVPPLSVTDGPEFEPFEFPDLSGATLNPLSATFPSADTGAGVPSRSARVESMREVNPVDSIRERHERRNLYKNQADIILRLQKDRSNSWLIDMNSVPQNTKREYLKLLTKLAETGITLKALQAIAQGLQFSGIGESDNKGKIQYVWNLFSDNRNVDQGITDPTVKDELRDIRSLIRANGALIPDPNSGLDMTRGGGVVYTLMKKKQSGGNLMDTNNLPSLNSSE